MKTYMLVYLGATGLSLLATFLAIRLARAIGAVDRPGVRRIHKKPIPRIGGVAIVFASMAIALPVLILDRAVAQNFRQVLPQVLVLLCAGGFIFAVGLIDDIRGLRARHKLLAQLAAAVAVCAFGARIEVLKIEGLMQVQLGWLGWPLTIVWIIGITNAINLIDGLDGLAAGIAAITCAVIAVFSAYTGQLAVTVLMLAMFGALTGFLFFGFNPANIFLGDCGALFLGFMLAGASVLSSVKAPTAVALALPVLAMGVPIFDTLLSMLRRWLERRSVFAPDSGHIHHRLLKIGLHQRHAVLILYAVTALAAGLGMFMMITRNVATLLVFLSVLVLVALIFRVIGGVGLRETLPHLRRRFALARQCRRAREDFEKAQLVLREARSFEQWWHAMCSAADSLEIVRVLLTVPDEDCGVRTFLWQRSGHPHESRNAVQMRLPCNGRYLQAESTILIDVVVNGCLELAGHRANLFGRLTEEHVSFGPAVGGEPSADEETNYEPLRMSA